MTDENLLETEEGYRARIIALEAYVVALLRRACLDSPDPMAEMDALHRRAIDSFPPYLMDMRTETAQQAMDAIPGFVKHFMFRPPA